MDKFVIRFLSSYEIFNNKHALFSNVSHHGWIQTQMTDDSRK